MSLGTLYIVSAPSGAGKTSLLQRLIETTDDVTLSISLTTRPRRPREQDGVHYHFVPRSVFERMITEAAFLEYAEVFGNLYGTSRAAVQSALDTGSDVILEIDWQGAQQIRRVFPDSHSLFILPPSRDTLRKRLTGRGQDSPAVIERRMAAAWEELSHCMEFDDWVVNDDFDAALRALQAILIARRQRRSAQMIRHAALMHTLLT